MPVIGILAVGVSSINVSVGNTVVVAVFVTCAVDGARIVPTGVCDVLVG